MAFTSLRNTFTFSGVQWKERELRSKKLFITRFKICKFTIKQLFQKLLRARTSFSQVPLSSAAADTSKRRMSQRSGKRAHQPVWKNRSGVERLCSIQNREDSINVGQVIWLLKTPNWILHYRILLIQRFHWQTQGKQPDSVVQVKWG